ncbi:hypothetical protein [Geothrix sp. PMB-07]|uniref:hypothetical protein n=1 Tax=Geothrix sp. PMB-07 TaxID=3068640 RepID=UPI0027414A5B|nr:hypothetical protein [Geothrix sp. PMB-07]WLT33147.1 hypothetical protein Q9293_07400 [Geothrix sp. PMB-07]
MLRRISSMLMAAGVALLAEAPPKAAQAPPAVTPAGVSTEDVALIKAVPYRPSIQRDPFSAPREDRPVDALDLLDDIGVKGMIRKDGKNFAVVTDSRGNARWLPVGHRFKDGEISDITDKEVVFHQWDVNTTNRSVFRTIKKTFKREEGKR